MAQDMIVIPGISREHLDRLESPVVYRGQFVGWAFGPATARRVAGVPQDREYIELTTMMFSTDDEGLRELGAWNIA